MIFADTNFKIEENFRDFLSLPSIYAHGDLQHILEYDLVSTDRIRTFSSLFTFFMPDDIITFSETAEDAKGELHEVTIYGWKTPMRILGLIVLNDDVSSIEEAKIKQKEKCKFL